MFRFSAFVKMLSNRLVAQKEFHVPEGRVLLADFENLLEYDAKKNFKYVYKFMRTHVHPEQHEKMTTKYDFQLFSGTVADASRR